MAETLEIKLVEDATPAFDPAGPDPARLAEAQQEAAEAWAQTLQLQKKATGAALATTATPAFSPSGPATGHAPPDLAGPLSEEPKERSEQLFELLRRQSPQQPKPAAPEPPPEPPAPTDLQRDYAEAARRAVEQAERGAAYAKAQVTKGPQPVPEGLEEEDTPEVQRVDPGADAREMLRRREAQRRQEQMQREHQEEVRKQMRSLSPDFRREDDQRQQKEGQGDRKESIQRIVGYGAAGAQAGAAAAGEDSGSRDMRRIGQGIGAAGNIAMGVASKDPMKVAEGAMQLMQLQEQMRKDREEDRRQRVEWVGRQATRAAALDPGQFGDVLQEQTKKIKEFGPAAAEFVQQFRNVTNALVGTFREHAGFNAQMAQARALIEVRDILRKIERGDKLAEGLSRIADAQNRVENSIKDIQAGVIKPFLKPLAAVLGKVSDILEDIAKRFGAKDADEASKAGDKIMSEFMSAPDDFFPGRGAAGAAAGLFPVGGGR